MSAAVGGIRIVPKPGSSATVTFTRGGTTPPCFADPYVTTPLALPAVITTQTDFWFTVPGLYTVSTVLNGVENANGEGGTTTVQVSDGGLGTVGANPLLGSQAYSATYASQDKVIRARSVDVWGHSYSFGIGASDVAKRTGAILADEYGLPERNEAVAGTAIGSDNSGASWAKVLQYVTRPSRGAVAGSGVTATAKRGFASPEGLIVALYGINDLNLLGNDANAVKPITEALRTALSRWRAGAIFEDPDATFTFTGAWSTNADLTRNSGAGYRYSTSGASTYSILTPADFPGGTVAIGLHAQSPSGGGATHTATYAGQTYVCDAHATRSGTATHFMLRIPNVAAGAQTITVTLASLVTLSAVDYWQWEAPADDGPLVVLCKQPYPTDYSLYGVVAPGPPTDAGVDLLNAAIDAIAAEFGPRVVTVDLSVMNHDAAMFAAVDKLHPSDKGHAMIATKVVAAVRAAGYAVVGVPDPRAPRVEYGTAAPTTTRVFAYVGDRIVNTAPAVLGSAASQYVTREWVCTVEGRPGTWAEQRMLTGT
jgi:lysophospholipase L1-like esterase